MGTEKVICDTDVMIDYFDENQLRHKATRITLEEVIGIDNVVISAITKIELLTGARNKRQLSQLDYKIGRYNLLLIGPEITLESIRLISEYNLSHNLAMPDAVIAATAMFKNYRLFTYNIKDYRFIKGLKLFNH